MSEISPTDFQEMCFDCSAFQYQLPQDKPFEDHIFQTIFLNNKHEETWSKHEIRKDKIVREDWWHQLCHSWTHYAFVVPFVWALNRNSRHTTYAAAWTLVNAHEVACISGQVRESGSMISYYLFIPPDSIFPSPPASTTCLFPPSSIFPSPPAPITLLRRFSQCLRLFSQC